MYGTPKYRQRVYLHVETIISIGIKETAQLAILFSVFVFDTILPLASNIVSFLDQSPTHLWGLWHAEFSSCRRERNTPRYIMTPYHTSPMLPSLTVGLEWRGWVNPSWFSPKSQNKAPWHFPDILQIFPDIFRHFLGYNPIYGTTRIIYNQLSPSQKA